MASVNAFDEEFYGGYVISHITGDLIVAFVLIQMLAKRVLEFQFGVVRGEVLLLELIEGGLKRTFRVNAALNRSSALLRPKVGLLAQVLLCGVPGR